MPSPPLTQFPGISARDWMAAYNQSKEKPLERIPGPGQGQGQAAGGPGGPGAAGQALAADAVPGDGKGLGQAMQAADDEWHCRHVVVHQAQAVYGCHLVKDTCIWARLHCLRFANDIWAGPTAIHKPSARVQI